MDNPINSNKGFTQHSGSLSDELDTPAKRLLSTTLLRTRTKQLLILCSAALFLLSLSLFIPILHSFAFGIFFIGCLATVFNSYSDFRKQPKDYQCVARAVEKKYPDLNETLSTAIEQDATPFDQRSFLQNKVIKDAIQHPSRWYWVDVGKEEWHRQLLGSLGSLLIMAGTFVLFSLVTPTPEERSQSLIVSHTLKVSPGTIEVERGSAVLVTVRFEDKIPSDAFLVTTNEQRETKRIPMARSLSDPIFAHTLLGLKDSLSYKIEFNENNTSDAYELSIFDFPELSQANAALEFPQYTGLDPREVIDIKSISAVEGTQLQYSFIVNKALKTAELIDSDGNVIRLKPENDERTRFSMTRILENSLHAKLHLTDQQNRINPYPADIRIEAVENKRPKLDIIFPKGDQRISPIEEFELQADISDDFGITDYGFALSQGASLPEYRSLKTDTPQVFSRKFIEKVEFENMNVVPDDLISYFIWADDFGPDGEIRRSTSDLFFAEVRSLDEIFREGESGSGQQQGGQAGSQDEELLEQQRQMAIAVWKMKNRDSLESQFTEDLKILETSQEEIKAKLDGLKPQIQEPKLIELATTAGELMAEASDQLDKASDTRSALDPAWTAAQGAYQALLRMQPKETNVTRSQEQSGGQGGQSRSQSQLNQLSFNQEEDRYETENQAQSLATPEERKQIETLSKLSELARRQQDINERLQELQTALAAAQEDEEEERIRRELKRLEDEQRELIANVDEARQSMEEMSSNQENREAKQRLDDTRQNMQRSSEKLEDGDVSQALASGSRAQNQLEDLKEDFRKNNSSQFADQLRQARRTAQELAEKQNEIETELDNLKQDGFSKLDDSEERREVANDLDAQKEQLENLFQSLRQITENSEVSEPRLHRELYDLLREQGQKEMKEQLEIGAQVLRRGFIEQAQNAQSGLQQQLDKLKSGISEAAESILGDETSTLKFAKNELEALSEQIEKERAPAEADSDRLNNMPNQSTKSDSPNIGNQIADTSSETAETNNGQQSPNHTAKDSNSQIQQGTATPSGTPSTSNEGSSDVSNQLASDLENFLQSMQSENTSSNTPLTGQGFAHWAERLRTVEELMQSPDARQRLSQARETAEQFRRDFKRSGEVPQWEIVNSSIVEPLIEVSSWLKQELDRIDSPDTLQPIDRDPVPQAYEESVRRYYEALSEDQNTLESL